MTTRPLAPVHHHPSPIHPSIRCRPPSTRNPPSSLFVSQPLLFDVRCDCPNTSRLLCIYTYTIYPFHIYTQYLILHYTHLHTFTPSHLHTFTLSHPHTPNHLLHPTQTHFIRTLSNQPPHYTKQTSPFVDTIPIPPRFLYICCYLFLTAYLHWTRTVSLAGVFHAS